MVITYCIPNAPHQHGDLWVEINGNQVVVLNPTSDWWRGKTFTLAEFEQIFKDRK